MNMSTKNDAYRCLQKNLHKNLFYLKIVFLSLEATINVIFLRNESLIIMLDNDHRELRRFLFLTYIHMVILPSSPSKNLSYMDIILSKPNPKDLAVLPIVKQIFY